MFYTIIMFNVLSMQKRILILEDDPLVAKSLKRAFQKAKFEIETANTLSQALKLLEESTFDLCVTDLGLPDGSGMGLIEYARKHSQHKSMPILVNTGFSKPTEEEFRKFSPIRIFRKPTPAKDLLDAAKQFLKGGGEK